MSLNFFTKNNMKKLDTLAALKDVKAEDVTAAQLEAVNAELAEACISAVEATAQGALATAQARVTELEGQLATATATATTLQGTVDTQAAEITALKPDVAATTHTPEPEDDDEETPEGGTTSDKFEDTPSARVMRENGML